MAAEYDTEVVAYTTIDDVVHNVVWCDWAYGSDLVVQCTRKGAGSTRAANTPEKVTCLSCLSLHVP